MRKNQYEEALFRVEDDRFELDMMIETNASAMRTMANLARQLEVRVPPCLTADCGQRPALTHTNQAESRCWQGGWAAIWPHNHGHCFEGSMVIRCMLSFQELDPEERARWSPPGPGERGALNAVHLRAVQRIYGEAGQQVGCWGFLLPLAVSWRPCQSFNCWITATSHSFPHADGGAAAEEPSGGRPSRAGAPGAEGLRMVRLGCHFLVTTELSS
jgi:Sin3 family co-repressor